VISEFISPGPGLLLVPSISDEAALPSAERRQRMATQDTVGFLPTAFPRQPSHRSTREKVYKHFKKEYSQ
jgi:hypothetical protein